MRTGCVASRRHFLKTSAGALAVASLCADSVIGGPKDKVIVGAHPWVYAATQPKYDITPVLPQIFADMEYAGMDGIELMHTALRNDPAVAQIEALAKKHHLSVIGSSWSGAMWDRTKHQEVLADAELVIRRLGQLGGRTLGISVGSAPRRKTEEQLDAQAEALRAILAFGKAHGVVANLHNHTYEVVDGMHDLKGTLARVPDVALGPDLNWLLRGGVAPVQFLKTYGKQVVFLHLRDQKADGRWSEALGEGVMDYQAIASALRAIPFRGDAVIELAHERDFRPIRPLRESLRISRQFVRTVLGY